MKKITLKKPISQSLLSAIIVSALILAVFVFMAVSTFGGTSQQKFQLPDGRWELSRYLSGGKNELITGNVDDRGRFQGPVTIVYEKDFERTSTEEVHMAAGARHGTSKVTYVNGHIEYWCYEHGDVISKGICQEKSASVFVNDNSAYQIFSYEFPWFAFKLDAFGYDSSYVRAYMDTLESVLYANVFNEEDFDIYYEDVVDALDETPYDSIIQLNAELLLYNGLDLILSHEFRLASLDSYVKGDKNTYNVVTSIYPNYLLVLNAAGVTDTDFEGFCSEYDGIMSGYDPISPDDPYLLDSLDARMYRAMETIYTSDENSSSELKSLSNSFLPNTLNSFRTFLKENGLQINTLELSKTPTEVAEIVLSTILAEFINGDLIRKAVKEAFTIKNGIITLPSIVTVFSGNPSSISASIKGNVIKDGGGEVTSRGFAWGTVYNPTMDNQVISAGTGTGDFEATLSDLTEGETYYARAFATNSAGTAYGNCINFVAGGSSGIETGSLNSMDFSIYPNPASDNINISFKAENSKGMIFTMFDLSGKIVLRKNLNGIVQGENIIGINISEIESGMYTCRIEGEDNIYAIRKLFINR